MNRALSATSCLIVLCIAGTAPAQDADSRLNLADLAAYRAALRPPAAGADAAIYAGFGEIWSRPERFQGKRVRVEGQLARTFSTAAVGAFPDLTEAWLTTPSENPFCLVYPKDRGSPRLGTKLVFEGTFLKLVRYQGGDEPRLAPLIVGPGPPVEVSSAAAAPSLGFSKVDWAVAGVPAVLALLWIVARHASRPRPRATQVEPDPEFEG